MLLDEMWKPIKTIKMKTYSLDYLTKEKKIPKKRNKNNPFDKLSEIRFR